MKTKCVAFTVPALIVCLTICLSESFWWLAAATVLAFVQVLLLPSDEEFEAMTHREPRVVSSHPVEA
ncbi:MULTISPECIES: hypothetical protein [Bifidobacterium]|uniref:Uncharacterized protein n=2 Tax=Bifidobacterium TaxID=1678 RepID=A0A261FTT0_9BIFI|nr:MULTISPECIES: hypothetical protein [Bifidobacterium]OZG62498.1 hypothetical protein BLEM_1044 [Bifidobacterium lemurum]OZG69034.1 hypothetical protein BEUL_0440 [Bifidobacterium eulemuris]QOL31439.1 hypothetical protein BE0216_02430 [Bifidobacterium eulemuris]QOL33838.1 hypothetical protein BL8807_08650 [Bifidobacterium lemurum]